MIEVKNLTKIYKSKRKRKTKALDNVSFTLPKTGMIFIIGRSGSGKSTLLNMIGGLDDITSGDILIDGNNVSNLSLTSLANYRSTYIGFIFQDYHLLDDFTVKENIELSSDISNVSCDVAKCLKQVDLEGYENRFPYELSGGQSQRIAIARALAKDSKIILADEPTGNLDNKTTKQILNILKVISKDRLVLIVSHNLDDASKYADRIISLENGKIKSDLSRKDNYFNTFRIEDDILYLPHHTDLNDDNLDMIINEKDRYKKIIQIDNGMEDTKSIVIPNKKVELNKSKLSKEKFKKLFKLIFNRKVFTKITTIFVSAVLLSLFYVFQSFEAFNQNEQLMNDLISKEESTLVLKKNKYKNGQSSNSGNYIFPCEEDDVDKLYNVSYDGNIYKLYNYPIFIKTSSLSSFSYRTITNNTSLFYITETYGTLNCKEEFLINKYGIDGKLKVYGNLYDKDYGIVITDYIADSMIFYLENINSYDDILGLYPKTNHHTYINAIIETGYKERYNDLYSVFTRLWDDDLNNDNINDDIKNHPDYHSFLDEVNKYLGIGYNFSTNFEDAIYSTNTILRASIGQMILSSKDVLLEDTVTYIQGSLYKYDLEPNNIVMTTAFYNKLFGTEYNKDNLDEFSPCEVKFEKLIKNIGYFEKNYTIVGLMSGISNSILVSDEDFESFLEYKFIPYALYLDNLNNKNKKVLIDEISSNNYSILVNENLSVAYVTRAVNIFSKFLKILEATMILICVVYLIHFGYKSIKNNLYEIGIIEALGCHNKDVGKLFMLEILYVGVGILVVSIIGMWIAAVSANYILIISFEKVFNFNLNNISIITYNIRYVIIDLIISFIVITISALFPLYLIRKIKPVNILKAKE